MSKTITIVENVGLDELMPLIASTTKGQAYPVQQIAISGDVEMLGFTDDNGRLTFIDPVYFTERGLVTIEDTPDETSTESSEEPAA